MFLFSIVFSIDTLRSLKNALLPGVRYVVCCDRSTALFVMEKILQTTLSWGRFRFRATCHVQHTGSEINYRFRTPNVPKIDQNKCFPRPKPASVHFIMNFVRPANVERDRTGNNNKKEIKQPIRPFSARSRVSFYVLRMKP